MFAERLKACREAAGLTQAAFAERLKVPLRTMQNYEQGRREPVIEMLVPIARALGVTVDELLAVGEARPKGKGRPRKK